MNKWNVDSPNGRNVLQITLNDTNRPIYQLDVNGHAYIRPSVLGLKFDGTDLFSNGFSVMHVSNHSVQEEWVPTYGERSLIKNNYNNVTSA